jgi:hypothetical protein
MEEYQHSLKVKLGNSPLPFFAEYPYFLWGEVNYDSDGNSRKPTDRNWTALYLAHRSETDRLEILEVSTKPQIFQVQGIRFESVQLATYLTAFRTGGVVIEPNSAREIPLAELKKEISQLDEHFAEVEKIRTMFLNPVLAPFDSHSWWGGWKWCGDRATDLTMGLRLTMKAVTEQTADQEFIAHLYEWWSEPPESFHREGVRYAIKTLTGKDPENKGFLTRWFGRRRS